MDEVRRSQTNPPVRSLIAWVGTLGCVTLALMTAILSFIPGFDTEEMLSLRMASGAFLGAAFILAGIRFLRNATRLHDRP